MLYVCYREVITIDVSNRIDNNAKEEKVELEFTFDYE